MKFSLVSFSWILFFLALLIAGVMMVTGVVDVPSVHPIVDALNLQSLIILLAGLNLYAFAAYPPAVIRHAYASVLTYFSTSPVHRRSLQEDALQIRDWHRELTVGSTTTDTLSERFSGTLEGYVFTMAASGYSKEDIRQLAEIRIADRFEKASARAALFRNLGNAAPSFGLMGTLFGLIVMLSNIQNAQQLSQGLAVALMTTLYGVLLAQVMFLPLAVKMRHAAIQQFNRDRMMLDALEAILQGRSPLAVHDILIAHSVQPESIPPSGLPATATPS